MSISITSDLRAVCIYVLFIVTFDNEGILRPVLLWMSWELDTRTQQNLDAETVNSRLLLILTKCNLKCKQCGHGLNLLLSMGAD